MLHFIGKKKLVFTKHSLQRIIQRGLTEAWVADIVKNPTSTLPKGVDNTQEFIQKRSGNNYYAVIQHKGSILLVITAGEAGKK